MSRFREIEAVKVLGEQIGYGNLMNVASALWAIDLESKSIPESGAFVATIAPFVQAPHRKRIVAERAGRKREVKQRYFDRLEAKDS